jgi:hypothetical protein
MKTRWGRLTFMDAARIEEIEAKIAELKARLPKHSVQPAMLQELEDLEIELEQARAGTEESDGRQTGPG